MSAAWRDQSDTLLSNPELRGRLVEAAVGACLLNRAGAEGLELFWWRDGGDEVDFAVRSGERVTAIEVKSGRAKGLGGLAAFVGRFPAARPLVVGADANPLEAFSRGEVPLFG